VKEEACEPFTTSDPIPTSSPTALARGSGPSTTGADLALLPESRCQVARRCLREERLRYVDGIVTAQTAETLRFGTLWHHAQEAWWLAKQRGESEAAWLTHAVSQLFWSATPETDAYELARAEAMMEGYHARWSGEQFEVLGVELEFRAPLLNPETGAASRTFQRAGRVDVVVRDATGRKLLVEHKSSGEDIAPGSSFWARLRMGGQAAGYIRGAEALGHDVDGVVYDVAKKPELRPLKATPLAERQYTKGKYRLCPECKKKRGAIPAPHQFPPLVEGGPPLMCQEETEHGTGARVVVTDPGGRLYANQRETDETVDEYRDRVRAAIAQDPEKHFQRGLVVRLEDNLAEADGELWQLGQTLREHHRLQLAPRNTDACQRYGSTCTYFAICAGEASADDDRQYRRLSWPHPELTNPKEEG
jgi:hypothetical protein